jgi:hypothetical protein
MTAHLETCSHCQTELALYQSFEAARIEPEEAGAVDEISARLRARTPAAAVRPRWLNMRLNMRAASWFTPAALTAAGVLVAVAIGLEMRHGAAPPLHPLSTPQIMRSTAVTVVAPVGDLETTPAQIQWQPVPGAAQYRVRLLEVDRNELWSSMTAGHSIDLPAAIRALLVPGKTVLCEVTALNSTGATIAYSGPVRFRVLQNIHTR